MFLYFSPPKNMQGIFFEPGGIAFIVHCCVAHVSNLFQFDKGKNLSGWKYNKLNRIKTEVAE
jgi:hypothetical protein